MRWWDDLWLNEGFASTLMYFAMDDAHPEWNVVTYICNKKQDEMLQRSLSQFSSHYILIFFV